MRSEFEKLPQIESHLHNVVFDEGSNEYLAKKMGHLPFEFSEWFLNGSWTIYQHQQSKIDELQKQRDSFIKAYEIEVNESVELKKRVDAVNLVLEGLKNANYMHSGNKAYNSLLIEKLEQALKEGGE